MKTDKSTSKGGRPKYLLEDEDIKLARDLAEEGITLKQIALALGVADSTMKELRKRDERFSAAIKRGRVAEYIKANRQLKNSEGGIPPAIYIYWSKTKWKNFYPQEKQTLDTDNLSELKITFTKAANHEDGSNKQT